MRKLCITEVALHEFVLKATRLLQSQQLLANSIQCYCLPTRLRADICAVAHIDRASVKLILSNDFGCGRQQTTLRVLRQRAHRE